MSTNCGQHVWPVIQLKFSVPDFATIHSALQHFWLVQYLNNFRQELFVCEV